MQVKKIKLKLNVNYLTGLFLWVVLSNFYLRFIPNEWWQYRDDSVIHLSQALNLSTFGSIGLSPGSRVEAVSTPLNFITSFIFFSIYPSLDYSTYLDIFIPATLALLSLSITYSLNKMYYRHDKKTSLIILLQVLIFTITLSSWTSFGWIISGMENVFCAIFLILFIGAIAGKTISFRVAIISLSLLGICRIELPLFLFPLLIILLLRDTVIPRRKIMLGASIPPIFWLFVNLARYSYYGEILPNTAVALNIEASKLSILILLLEYSILCISFVKLRINGWSNSKINFGIYTLLVVSSFFKIQEMRYENLYKAFLVICLISVLIIMGTILHAKKMSFNFLVTLSIPLIPLNHYIMFGPSRLSAFRIISSFLIPIILCICWVYFRNNLEYNKKLSVSFIPLLFIIPLCFLIYKVDSHRNLCCAISPSDTRILGATDDLLNDFGTKEILPIVANPDLGKISFSKKIMSVDLGLLGDPLLSRINETSPDLISKYLVEYAAPDIIELHGYWLCRYSQLVVDKTFTVEWIKVWSGEISNEFNDPVQITCPFQGEYTIWKRLVSNNEKQVTLEISRQPKDEIVSIIKKEIADCSNLNSLVSRCQYVTRSILRNRGYLIEKKWLKDTVLALKESPTYELDHLRLIEPPGWASKAVEIINNKI